MAIKEARKRRTQSGQAREEGWQGDSEGSNTDGESERNANRSNGEGRQLPGYSALYTHFCFRVFFSHLILAPVKSSLSNIAGLRGQPVRLAFGFDFLAELQNCHTHTRTRTIHLWSHSCLCVCV